MICPCCGQRMTEPTPALLASKALPPVQSALVTALAKDFGSYVKTPVITQRIWGLDPSGGPEYPGINVSMAVRRTNKRLSEFGLRITNKPWLGYRLEAA